MDITLNIEQYINHDEIKEMIESEVEYLIKDRVRRAIDSSSISSIISNTASRIVMDILAEQDIDLHQKIAEKTLECIDELSIYYVLRNNDNGEKSKAQQVLDECVEDARPKIQEKINSIVVDKIDTDLVIDVVVDAFYNKLHSQLTGK